MIVKLKLQKKIIDRTYLNISNTEKNILFIIQYLSWVSSTPRPMLDPTNHKTHRPMEIPEYLTNGRATVSVTVDTLYPMLILDKYTIQ